MWCTKLLPLAWALCAAAQAPITIEIPVTTVVDGGTIVATTTYVHGPPHPSTTTTDAAGTVSSTSDQDPATTTSVTTGTASPPTGVGSPIYGTHTEITSTITNSGTTSTTSEPPTTDTVTMAPIPPKSSSTTYITTTTQNDNGAIIPIVIPIPIPIGAPPGAIPPGGGVPPEDPKPPSDDDNNSQDDDDDDEECTTDTAKIVTVVCESVAITAKESVVPTTTCSPSTTATTTGCSITDSTTTVTKPCSSNTADLVTVSCKSTATPNDHSMVTTTTCSPATTVTTTGCVVTNSTTTITATPVPKKDVCSPENCGAEEGESCPIPRPGMSGGWGKTEPLNCSMIPNIKVDKLPKERDGIEVILGSEEQLKLTKRVPPHMTRDKPLPDLTGKSKAELRQLMNHQSKDIERGLGEWLEKGHGISSKWFPIPDNAKSRFGVKGLTGCTVVLIFSRDGAWIGHMWEKPIFDTDFGPVPEDLFQASTFYAFRDATLEGEIQPIMSLIGTDQNPGPLHWSRQPVIVVVAPYSDHPGGGAKYPARTKWLLQQFSELIFPNGIPQDRVAARVYPNMVVSEKDANSKIGAFGRVILEVTPVNQQIYSDNGAERLVQGKWRVWASGTWILDTSFWTQDNWQGISGIQAPSKRQQPNLYDCPIEEPRELCSPETCNDDTCSLDDGEAGWIEFEPVECAAIPTITGGTPPAKTGQTELITSDGKRSDVVKRAPGDLRPLRDVTQMTQGQRMTRILNISTRLSNPPVSTPETGPRVGWLPLGRDGLSSQWYQFETKFIDIQAMGVRGLKGCTAVFIVSSQGVWISHIWENPNFRVWIDQANGIYAPTSDAEFLQRVWVPLRDGRGPGVQGIVDLQQRLLLAEGYQPKVIVVTPFVSRYDKSRLRYQARAIWLAEQFENLLYPDGFTGEPQNRRVIYGYLDVSEHHGADLDRGQQTGRAMMEVAVQNEHRVFQNTRYTLGRYRLWVGPDWACDVDFYNGKADLEVGFNAQGRALHKRDNPCAPEEAIDVCSPGTCDDDACSLGDEKGKWVAMDQIDCAAIPTMTVEKPPTATEEARFVKISRTEKRSDMIERAFSEPTRPLRDIDKMDEKERNQAMKSISERLGKSKYSAWHQLQKKKGLSSKWYDFTTNRNLEVFGVKGLGGCTAALVISSQGVWISHIFERPNFISDRGRKQVSLDTFKEKTFGPLRDGSGDEVEGVNKLIGTDGRLFHRHNKTLLYEERAEWLADELERLVYGKDFTGDEKHQIILGYVRPDKSANATKDDGISGRALLELTPRNHFEWRKDWRLTIGRFRLWLSGAHAFDVDYFNAKEVYHAKELGPKGRPLDNKKDPVCPGTTVPATLLPTTTKTTTTTTKTKPPGPTHTDPWNKDIGKPDCYDKDNREWDKNAISDLAVGCEVAINATTSMGADDEIFWWAGDSEHDNDPEKRKQHYEAWIWWVEGCRAPRKDPWYPKTIKNPFKRFDCEAVIKNIFDGCEARSGGRMQFDCLAYEGKWKKSYKDE
ncbi:uncharacterized protein BDV17DRAFT_291146 [Aspergillus undulatus]|uniref:uncharacterized protein n=1 Tax=Aspergillus undulatus TaxID=1810928 RepID=UPI003CCC9FAA